MTKAYRKAEFRAMLEDHNLRRWYSNYAKGSPIVADVLPPWPRTADIVIATGIDHARNLMVANR